MKRLTEEDKKLWRAVTKGAAPLRLRVKPEREEEKPAAPKPPAQKKSIVPPASSPDKSLVIGKKEPPGREVDIRTLTKFKRGQMAIDGVIDLHGYNLADARSEVLGFIRLKHGQGARCLLVIHGKGMLTGQAKIKRALPDWLTDLADIVLAQAPAQPKHGGHGASYLLLRRKRVTGRT